MRTMFSRCLTWACALLLEFLQLGEFLTLHLVDSKQLVRIPAGQRVEEVASFDHGLFSLGRGCGSQGFGSFEK